MSPRAPADSRSRSRPGPGAIAGKTLSWLLLAASGILATRWAERAPMTIDAIYGRRLFPWIAAAIGIPGRATRADLAQILLAAGLALLLLYLVFGTLRAARHRSFIAGYGRPDHIAAALAIGVWAFQLSWGLNYARPPLAGRLGLRPAPVEPANLARLVRKLAGEVNETYRRAADARQYTPESRGGAGSSLRVDADVVADRLSAAYRTIIPSFGSLPLARPKFPAAAGSILTFTGVSGIYFPFTGEATVNARLPDASVPFVMAHEMAHQRGTAPEDEANFLAYLSCRESGLAAAHYSGALSAFGLAWNALAVAAPDSARLLGPGLLDAGPLADRAAIREFWERHRGVATDLAEQVNSAYLCANHQRGGVASYGRAVDLLLAAEAAGLLDEP